MDKFDILGVAKVIIISGNSSLTSSIETNYSTSNYLIGILIKYLP